MSEYILSAKAEDDLIGIFRYSRNTFGLSKARSYLAALHERLAELAENQGLGRKADYIRAGYFRCEHDSHSIFYKNQDADILIVRVLHNKMDAPRHL